ncbi:MAG TPA: hypothetical protein VGD05_12330 [Pyrinomonadaceae bacterium]|jgi:hypothetical protein
MPTSLLPNKLLTLSERKNKASGKIDQYVFGQKLGLMAMLFGCWHNNIGRPFVQGKTAYRSCLQCGARKQFNTETLETHGNFYFPPVVKAETINKS